MSREREELSAHPRSRVLARAVGLNVAGQAGGFAVAFFSAILLARTLGPADRGLLAIMVVVSTVVLSLFGAGIQVAVQYYAGRKETEQRALLGNSLVYGAAIAAIVIPAFFLLRRPLADALGHGHGGLVWGLAAVLIPLTFLDYTIAGQLCGRLEFGLWNVLLVCSRLASLVAIVVLVAVLGLGIAGGVLATATGSIVVVAVAAARLMRLGRPRFDPGLFRSCVRYGARAQIGGFFQLVNFRLDLLVLGMFASLSNVGHYAVAQTLAELVAYLGIAFQISVLPILAGSDRDEQAETSSAAVRHHSVLALVLVLANAVFAPLVLVFGYGAEFHAALVPLFILIPGMWFMGTGSMVVGDLRGRGRPGVASAIKGTVAVVTVALDVILIPLYGVVGAAIASTLAYTTFGVLSLVVLSRLSGVPVRRLAVPTREDLAAYPRAARSLLARVRGNVAEGDGLDLVLGPKPLVVTD